MSFLESQVLAPHHVLLHKSKFRISSLSALFRNFTGNAVLRGNVPSLEIGQSGLSESEVFRVCRVLENTAVLRRGTVALELGAGRGASTLQLATCGLFSKVFAVEPEPDNFKELTQKVSHDGLADVVECVRYAAGAIDGLVNLHINRTDRLKSSIKRQKESDVALRVPLSTVETMLTEARITPDRVGLVWVDIEGYEAMACLGLRHLMAIGVPLYIVFSASEVQACQMESLLRLLASYYHRCVVFDGSSVHVAPISMVRVDKAGVRLLLVD